MRGADVKTAMKDLRVKHLLVTLLYFLVVVLLAGIAMILASKSIREAPVFWLVKQVLPAVILASFLATGILGFDRIGIPYKPIEERVRRIAGLLPFVPLGAAIFVMSALVAYAVSGHVPNNSVYLEMPLARFLPYFLAATVFTGIIQPVLEEIVFRGRLLPVASGVIGTWAAVPLVSILFALLHYSNLYSSFLFSVVMCLVALRFGVRACVTTHISYNVISILVDAF